METPPEPRPSLANLIGPWVGRARRVLSWPWEWEARFRGVEMGAGVVFLGRPLLTMAAGSRMVLHGENQIASSTRCTGLGNIQPAVLRTLLPGSLLELGKGAGVSGAAICAASSIVIGEGTIIGAGAMIFDTDFHQPMGELGWRDEDGKSASTLR